MSHSHSRAACNLIIIILFLCVVHSDFRIPTRHYQLYTKKLRNQLPNHGKLYFGIDPQPSTLSPHQGGPDGGIDVHQDHCQGSSRSRVCQDQYKSSGRRSRYEPPVGKAYRKDPQDQPSQQGTDDEQHHQFEDACAAGRLNLSNGEKIYSRFRELLGEVFRADWDNALQGKANLVAGFHKTLNEFISYHFSNTDLIDQKNMLAKAKKPLKYTVKVLCSHLRHLNRLMSKLPGANNTLLYGKGALKIKLFKMMLTDWQINFNNMGLEITDDAYTLQCLVRFMTV
jgi:hypothetical protein